MFTDKPATLLDGPFSPRVPCVDDAAPPTGTPRRVDGHVTLEQRLRGALAGSYAIERELGRGGMATVYLAQDLKHKRPVAVKVLNPEIGRMVGPERFLREIEIAARLTHPHILPVFDSGTADDLLYYVMPFVRGESLRQRIEREGALPIGDAVRIAREVADALDYAHRRGYVHRDVKPENVLLEEGHAFVADFGVARALAGDGAAASKLTEVGIAIGTPYYMSPEQAAGDERIDGRADLYALGCVLYEMLSGKPVFEGATAQTVARQHLYDTPRRLRTLRTDVPPALETVVARALAKTPAERWTSGAEIAAALESGDVPAFRAGRRRGRWLALGGAVAAAATAVLVLRGARGDRPVDPALVAVAPFDVLAPELQLWREGLVDVVARNLDGAGAIRIVAPTIAVRRWEGRADAPSARLLGRRTGAGLAVFGTLVSAGGDSVRLTATLYDVAAARPIQDFQVRDVADRMDRVADSLSLELLRALPGTRQMGAVRLVSVGTGSLPALRAFLRAEQFYRQTNWDSAITYYERAIAQDSAFAMPWWRVGTALGWQRSGIDTLSRRYHARAGALNRGLAPRDSLLVAADSLTAAIYSKGLAADWQRGLRLFAGLEDAVRRYPEDPEVWYALGEARYHFGRGMPQGTPDRQTLAAFDRAIALDSAFGPAYIHAVQLGLALDGTPAALRYADAYLALDPKDVNAAGIRLVRALLAGDPGAEALLDSATHQELIHAIGSSFGGSDSTEVAVRIAREALRRPKSGPLDSLADRYRLSGILASRGHLREAVGLAGDAPFLAADMMAFGAVTPDSTEAAFRRWLATDWLESALPRWWAARGDTGMIQAYIARLDSVARGAPLRRPDLRGVPPALLQRRIALARTGGRAALELARGDSGAALRTLLAVPDSACPECGALQLGTAHLLAATGRLEEAAARLDRGGFCCGGDVGPLMALERGRVAERLGRREAAIESYRYVAAVWRNADSALRPYVEEARAALGRLTGERAGR